MSNLADPAHLSPKERLCDVAAILAAGILPLKQLPRTCPPRLVPRT